MIYTIKESRVFLVLAMVFSSYYIRIQTDLLWTFFYMVSLMLGVWIFRDKTSQNRRRTKSK